VGGGRVRAAAAVHAGAFHAGMLGRMVQVVAERGGRGHTEHFAPVRLVGSGGEVGRVVVGRVVGADAAGLAVQPGADRPM